MKIKVNIPGFGDRYCSNNVEFTLYDYGYEYTHYVFYKKGTYIVHNEYGPSRYWRDNGSYIYFINGQRHRLSGPSYHQGNLYSYAVIGKDMGWSKEEFIKNLANVLIPKEDE